MWFGLRLSEGLGEFSQQRINTAFILATRAVQVMVFKEWGHIFKLFRYNSVWRCQSGSKVDKKCISLSARHFYRGTQSELQPGTQRCCWSLWHYTVVRKYKLQDLMHVSECLHFHGSGKKMSVLTWVSRFSLLGKVSVREALQQEILHNLTHFLTKLVKLTQQCKVLMWVYNFIQIQLINMENLAQNFWQIAEYIWVFPRIHTKTKIYSKYPIM